MALDPDNGELMATEESVSLERLTAECPIHGPDSPSGARVALVGVAESGTRAPPGSGRRNSKPSKDSTKQPVACSTSSRKSGC